MSGGNLSELLYTTQRLKEMVEEYGGSDLLGTSCLFVKGVLELFEQIIQSEMGDGEFD